MSQTRGSQVKLIALAVATAAVFAWVLFTLVPMIMPARDTRALETPGWTLANELNAALVSEPGFEDTAIVVDSEEPLKMRIVGAVDSREDLDDLRAFIRERRPQGDIEFEVEIMDGH